MFDSHHLLTPEMKSCIEDCHQCHSTCLEMAMTHCVERGGRHTEPAHMRLMLDCAEICQTAMNFLTRHSAHHAIVCRACAASCERWATCRTASMSACAAPKAANGWRPSPHRRGTPPAFCVSAGSCEPGKGVTPLMRIIYVRGWRRCK